MKNVGLGRIGYLSKKITINELIQKMKKLLKQKTFRLALGNGKNLSKFQESSFNKKIYKIQAF